MCNKKIKYREKLKRIVKIGKTNIFGHCALTPWKFSIRKRFPPFDSVLQNFSTLQKNGKRKKKKNSTLSQTRRKPRNHVRIWFIWSGLESRNHSKSENSRGIRRFFLLSNLRSIPPRRGRSPPWFPVVQRSTPRE